MQIKSFILNDVSIKSLRYICYYDIFLIDTTINEKLTKNY